MSAAFLRIISNQYDMINLSSLKISMATFVLSIGLEGFHPVFL